VKRNICVAIETTGKALGLSIHSFGGIFGDDKVLSRFFRETKAKQSDLIIPTLSHLLKKSRVGKKEISLVAVDIGPGSFTGVRMGVATARTLGQALKVPVVGISSLEIIAEQSHEIASPPSAVRNDKYLITTLPALPGELYFAVFKVVDSKRAGESEIKPVVQPSWASELEFSKVTAKFKNARIEKSRALRPEILGRVAIRKFLQSKNRNKFDYFRTHPLYLQPSWAERNNPRPHQ